MITRRDLVREALTLLALCREHGVLDWRSLSDDDVCRALNRSPADVAAMRVRVVSAGAS